jgi:carboxylesterase
MQDSLHNDPFYYRYPQGKACLCLHGLGGGSYELVPLANRLYRQGLTVRGFNYPGHDSPAKQMPTSCWQDWYARTLEIYQELQKDYTEVSVIGFSTGCLLGLHLAAQYSIEKLVLLSPFLRIRHRWYYGLRPETYVKKLGQWIQKVPRLTLPIQDPVMRAAATKVAYFQTFNIPAVRSALDLIDLVQQELPQIQTPLLIIQSRQDTVVDPQGAEDIRQVIGSQQKSLYELSHSDHIISLDRERETVFAQVIAFLETNG